MDTKADVELTLSNKVRPPEAAAARAKKNEELAAKANEMRERNAAQQAEPDTTEAEPAKPIEDVESIEFKMHDGRVVLIGPPKGVSLTMRIAMQIPEAVTNPVIDRLARVLMSIRSVNGERPKPITNLISLTTMANEIGDVGLDELHAIVAYYWRPLQIQDAQVLKKNLRG